VPNPVLENGKYDVLYDVGDVRALAACLSRLLIQPEEALERGELATVRVEEFYENVILPRLEAYLLGIYVMTSAGD
jgi:hypothetical protein